MKLLIQRVARAQVTVNTRQVASIGPGLLVLVGINQADTREVLPKVIHKLLHLRAFADGSSRFNRSLLDVSGDLLLVPQFTLDAQLKGHRPSFSQAAPPERAQPLYNSLLSGLKPLAPGKLASGVFGAHMQVSLQNDGPVTLILDIRP